MLHVPTEIPNKAVYNLYFTENLEVNKNDMNTIILLINKHISHFYLTIKEMHCEIKDRDYLVLICTVGNLITR